MNKNLILEVMPESQKQLFIELSNQEWISKFYLAGGTALALQIGHRQSIDFDFFIKDDFNKDSVIQDLQKLGSFRKTTETKNIIDGKLNEIRISFFKYDYPILFNFINYGNILIADKFDIAVMKLEAISGRGSRKDFVDLFFLMKEFSLQEILDKYELKYGINFSNDYNLFRALIYFEDAEKQPLPNLFEKIYWKDIKETIINEVKKISKIKLS